MKNPIRLAQRAFFNRFGPWNWIWVLAPLIVLAIAIPVELFFRRPVPWQAAQCRAAYSRALTAEDSARVDRMLVLPNAKTDRASTCGLVKAMESQRDVRPDTQRDTLVRTHSR